MVRKIGRYEVVNELGRGGFGHVYRAMDHTVGRQVAVKVLTASEEGVLTRFRGEATASGRLRHPNIVTVFDFGEQDGTPYIVMELLDGQDLQHAIDARTPLSMLHKMQILAQVASGLGHAHAAGIIHRDVKPANVMLLHDGSVKIMDFGIALITQATQSRLTPRGAVIGTFRYMAPEQFRGAEPDARSDIFSYGLMFYELLAGVHPFHAAEAAAQMYNILSVEPTPIRDLVPECPLGISSVMSRLLQKDPDLRYQTFDDVLFDLEPVLVDLRHTRAEELLAEARAARTKDQIEEASALVKQVLELAPSHPQARGFREELQTQIRRQTVRPKIDEFLRKGKESLAAGNPTEAVQNFESALRLDPTESLSHSLLEEARTAVEKMREATRLAGEAEGILRQGDPERASKLARQALDLIPNETRAHRVLAAAGSAIEEERRKAELARGLDQARRLIEIRSWKEAFGVLASLREQFPHSEEVRPLADQVRAGWEKDERTRLLTSGLADARQKIQQGDLDAALNDLTHLAAQYPESSDAAKMLQFVRGELDTRAHQALVKRSLEEALKAASAKNFDGAVRILDEALAHYPADPDLQKERRGIIAEQRDTARRSGAEHASTEAQKLRGQGQFDQALSVLDSCVAQHGPNTGITDLRSLIERDLESAKRTVELQKFLKQGRELLGKGQGQEVTRMVPGLPAHVRDNPQVTKMFQDAQQQVREWSEREAKLLQAIADANTYSEQAKFSEASIALDAFEKRYGAEPDVTAARKDVETARGRYQRDALIREAPGRIRALVNSGDLANAQTVLDEALAVSPQQAELLQLRNEIAGAEAKVAAEHAERDAQQRLTHARALIAGQPAEAVRVLDELERTFPGRPDVAVATAEAKGSLARKQWNEFRAEIERLCERGEFDAALKKADQAPLAPAGELASLRQFIAVRHEESLLRQATEAVQQANSLRAVDPKGALNRLKGLPAAVRDRAEIQQAIQECGAAVADAERRAAVAEVESLAGQNKSSKARTALKKALERYPGDPALVAIQARLDAPAVKEAPVKEAPKETKAAPIGSPQTAPQTAPPQSKKTVFMAIAAGAVVLIAGAVWMFSGKKPVPITSNLVAVNIQTDPPGASVQVGDQSCVSPNCQLNLAPGQYNIQAQLSGYQPGQQALTVVSGNPAGINLNLQPNAPPPPVAGTATGTLIVQVGEPDAIVKIDDVVFGRTMLDGKLQMNVEAAKHTVRVEKNGYESVPPSQNVALVAKSTKTLKFRLNRLVSKVTEPPTPVTQPPVIPPPVVQPLPNNPPPVVQPPPNNQTPVVPPVVQPPKPDPAEEDWQKIRGSADPNAFETYLRQHPGSSHAAEAQATRDRLNAAAQAAAAEKQQKEAALKEAQLKQAAEQKLNADRKAVQDVLTAVENAFAAKNEQQLRALFPSYANSDSVKNLFKAKDIAKLTIALKPVGAIQVNNDTAQVTVERTISQLYKNESKPRLSQSTVPLTLRRSGQSWVIQ